MNKDIKDNVDQLVAQLLYTFRDQLDSAKDEQEYLEIVASVFVFKNLVREHFIEQMKLDAQNSDEDIEVLLNNFEDMAEIAAHTVNEENQKSVVLN